MMRNAVPCVLALLVAAAFADTYLLRLGNGLDPIRYEVQIEAKQHVGPDEQTIKASYEFTHQALKIADDGRIPTLVTFGPGEGTLEHQAGTVTLSWSYEGAQALLMYRPNSRLTQALTALKDPAQGASMDPLAGYALAAWSIPLLEGSVEPGASVMNDLADEPSVTGTVLMHRRVITTFDEVRDVAGARAAFLSAVSEQKLADDHPTLSGSSVVEIKSALDIDTGWVLAADAVESGEVTVKTGPAAGTVVTTDELKCRIRIVDGPEVEFPTGDS